MFKHTILWAAVAVMVLGAWAGAAQASLIYYDSFSREGALVGTSPDIRPGTETYLGSSSAWQTNGTAAVARTSGTVNLPFVPQSGNIYQLSAEVSVIRLGSEHDWVAIGFGTDQLLSFCSTAAVGWMLIKDTGEVQTFLGPSTSGGSGAVTYSMPSVFSVVLNTQQPLWTFEWFVDGVSVRTPESFSVNPSIAYVGFSCASDRIEGTVDDFTLTPEPATLALLGLGGLGMLMGRRRVRG